MHGAFDILHNKLIKEGFEEDNPDHILFSLGDHFDRGEQNDLVLEYLLRFWKLNRFIGLRGNHDEFVLEYLNGDNSHYNVHYNGFGRTLQNLAPKFGQRKELFYDTSYAWTTRQVDVVEEIKSNYPDLKEFMLSLEEGLNIWSYSVYSCWIVI